MAKIFMSMSGEGRGHATRVRSLVEQMRDRHQITLFAPGDAYRFLEPIYGSADDVRLIEIPGLKFHYVNGKIRLFKTIREGFRFQARQLPSVMKLMTGEIREHNPDVLLTDFEPALPRAAARCGKPFLSMTHQHFLVACDLSSLPRSLRFFAWFIGLAVPMHYTRQKATIISSFFPVPLRKSWKHRATSLGPMIRPELREGAEAAGLLDGGDPNPGEGQEPFLLSYLRKQTREAALKELQKSPVPIKVYGLGVREPIGKLTFHEIHAERFVEDLIACRAVVSASGNQLLGECMYLGKPVLGLPETWHHEQLINAHFLKQKGCGDFVTLETFRVEDLVNFLEHIEEYRTQIRETCLGNDGTNEAVAIIERHIPAALTGAANS